MDRVIRSLFSLPAAGIVGVTVISLLTTLILQEDSIQPFKQHLWAEDIISAPLIEGSVFSQELVIPEGLAGETFQTAIFFGSKQNASVGSVEVTLTQVSHSQSHLASGLAPRPTLRKRFTFDGFSEGSAVMTIKGLAGNTELAPGILDIEKGEGADLQGLPNEEPLYLSVDWFKVVNGGKKLGLSFPNQFAVLLWLLPFSGLIALAWAGMKDT
jgi:hypothetical protein